MPFCKDCGSRYSFGEAICAKCGTLLSQIPGRSQEVDDMISHAPRAKRIVAGIIDVVFGYAVLIILLSLFLRRFVLLRFLRFGIVFALPHLYFLLKDSLEGKSVGKLIMGLVVYNENERKAGGLLDSIIRNWYLAIPVFGPTLFVFIVGAQIISGKPKRLGEASSGTVVVTDIEFIKAR